VTTVAAKKTGFDLAALLGEVSKSDTGPMAVELIDIDRIDANEANFYEMSELLPLANSIALDGLQQPLIVMPHEEDDHFTLLSGHRRRAAILMLVTDPDEPREDLRLVPCIRRHYESPAMAELALILANSTARVLTSAETMRQAERMEMLLYQLKEEGYTFPGKMRDHVAAACQASASKLARLKVIRENLVQPFMGQFEAGTLSEQAAYALARLPADGQSAVARVAGDKIISGGMAEGLERNWERLTAQHPCIYCGDMDAPCDNVDGKLKSAAISRYSWAACSGGCCCQCYRKADCIGACKLAKDQIEAEKAKEKKRQAERNAERLNELAKNRKATQKNAKRLLRAAEAAGLADDVKLKFTRWGGDGNDIATVRAWARGDGLDELTFYNPACDPHERVVELARQLKCSTDYLLGLTNDLTPWSQTWISVDDHYPEEGQFVLAVDKWGTMLPSVYWKARFMDSTTRSVGNESLRDIELWMPRPALPGERTWSGQDILEQMLAEKIRREGGKI